MSIQTILDRNRAEVVTIRATETVQSAADRMRAHGIAALIVKSGDAVTGLTSEREIVHAVSRHGEGALFHGGSGFRDPCRNHGCPGRYR